MARLFDGAGDVLSCSVGASGLTGAFTMVVVCRKQSNPASFMNLCTVHTSGGTSTFGLEIEDASSGNNLQVQVGSTFRLSTFSVTAAEGYVLLAGGKASGTTTPRVHKYVYGTNAWTHEDASGTAGNPASSAGGTVRWGLWEGADDFNGDVAVAAIFDRNLTDAEAEQLGFSLTHWHALGPVGMWVFDQAVTTQNVVDLTGNGANQSSLTGTAVATVSVPILSYGHDVQYLSSSAAAGGPANLTGDAADTAAATDAANRSLTQARATSDTAAATDATARALAQARTVADTAAATDTAVRAALALTRTTADTATATDAVTRTAPKARTATDSAAATDSAVGIAGKLRTAADTAAATDTATRGAQGFARTAVDTGTATDTATRTISNLRTATDAAAATDAATRTQPSARTTSDTAATADTVTRSAPKTRTTTDTAAATDTATGSVSSPGALSRTATDTAAASDTATRAAQTFTRAGADTSAATDAVVRTVGRSRTATDAATASDAASKLLIRGRTAADTALAADSAARAVQLFARTAADTALATDLAVGLNLSTIPRIGIDGGGAGSSLDVGTARAGLVDAGTVVSTIG